MVADAFSAIAPIYIRSFPTYWWLSVFYD